jgi:DNA repair exonuclease SbcCD ATPase subunit
LSEPVVFRSVTIEAFRGFRDRVAVPLDASVVILTGPNGTGKTSLFDAVLWCLTGRIPRLEALRARKNVEHIMNVYSVPGPAVVELEIDLNGSPLRLRRSGTHKDSLLEVTSDDSTWRGREAQSRLEGLFASQVDLSLETLLTGSGLLQQDLVRAILEAKPAQRYAELNALLGFAELEVFEKQINDRLDEVKARQQDVTEEAGRLQRQLAATEDEIATRVARLEALPAVEAAKTEYSAALAASGVNVAIEAVDSRSARQVVAEAAQLASRISDLDTELRSLEAALEQLPPPPGDLVALRQRIERLGTRSSEVTSRLEEVISAVQSESQRHELSRQLAAIALPLLDDHCPVCQQAIEVQVVRQRLEELMSTQPRLADLREQEASVRAEASAIAADLQVAEEELTRLTQAESQRASVLSRIELTRSFFLAVGTQTVTLTEPLIDSTGDAIDRGRVEDLVDRLHTLSMTADRLAIALASSDEERELRTLRADAKTLRQQHEEASQRRVKSEEAQANWASLLRGARASRLDVVKRRVAQMRPLFSDVFLRLNPHPTFKFLDLEQELFYSRGVALPMVEDPVTEMRADPAIVLSSAQANVVALSYFLAMGWVLGSRSLPFVLLDDPLQSLDDVNVLGFSDLCRFLRQGRQLVISTHDRRFAGLLERKLTPREPDQRSLILEFAGWDRSGPDLNWRYAEPQLEEGESRFLLTA